MSILSHKKISKTSLKKPPKIVVMFRIVTSIFRRLISWYKIIILLLLLILANSYKNQLLFYYNKYENYVLNKSNFSLTKVYIEGNHHVSDIEIAKKANLKMGMPIFSISLTNIKNNLEQISWIKNAVIIRKLPNQLTLKIEERKPISLWQSEKKLYLIDEEGIPILEERNLKDFKDLIILIGDDAPLHAASFLKILNKNEDLYKKISSATRIGERRWNVNFFGGLEVKLPEKNYEDAWIYIINLYENKNLFAQDITTIDLRVDNKLYVK